MIALISFFCVVSYTWKTVHYTTPFTPSRYDHCAVVLDGQLLVMAGRSYYYAQFLNDVWRSTDGLSWGNLSPSPAFSPRSAVGCAVFESQVVIVGGTVWDGSPVTWGSKEVWGSATGSSWTSWGPGNFPGRYYHGVATFQGKLWAISGNGDSGGHLTDVWCIESLSSGKWANATLSAAFPGRASFGLTVFGGKMWIAGGTGDYGTLPGDVCCT